MQRRLPPAFRPVLTALLACSLLAAAPATGGEEKIAAKVKWLSFDAAVEKAKKENKHLIVDIYTTWCGWCKVMDRQTYGNDEVAAFLNENFALAKVNGESSSKLTWNGRTLTEAKGAKVVAGRVALQSEGGEIHFRRVELTPIGK